MSHRSVVLVLFAAACAGSTRSSVSPSGKNEPTVWPDEGPATWAPRPTETAITANDLRTRLYGFADDSMLGRRIGEPGNYKGTGYIAGEFKRLGLKPGGDNGTYFQNLPYGPSGFDINSSKLVAGGRTLSPRTDWVPIAPTATNGVGADANLDNVQAVYAGRFGDTVTTLDPATFRGKIAVFTATAAQAGLGGGGRGAQPVLRCDSLANKFGAEAAARVEAQQRADSISRAGAGRGGRGGAAGGGGARDTRAQRAGAVGILFIALADPMELVRSTAGWVCR